MIRDVVVLPMHYADMESVRLILRWYLRYVRVLFHAPEAELCMHRVLVELLHWRLSHLVLTRSSEHEGQLFGFTAYDACTLDIALTLFLCAVQTRISRTATQGEILAYLKRLREQLRGTG